MKLSKFLVFILFLVLSSMAAKSQDFVYRPTNPAFGGNYLNYQWLLNSAEIQSDFEEEVTPRDTFRRDPLEDFQASLSRQILSQLSRQVMAKQFGEEAFGEGTYVFGNYEIEVTPGVDGLVIYILDTETGGETTVTIPHY